MFKLKMGMKYCAFCRRVNVFKNLVSRISNSAQCRRVQLLIVPLIVWYNVSYSSRLNWFVSDCLFSGQLHFQYTKNHYYSNQKTISIDFLRQESDTVNKMVLKFNLINISFLNLL